MRKPIRELRNETDLDIELDYANAEESSSDEGDDPSSEPRRSWLACFINMLARIASMFRQVFGFSHDYENLFSSEPENNRLDDEIYDIVNTLPEGSNYHQAAID